MKIKADKIRTYSSRFAETVVSAFFTDRDRITGREMASLTAIQQVNLFIIRELLVRWEAESARLKSPWFDYSARPVQEAFSNFRNVLSNHISVAREDFQPLVEKAAADTLLAALSPIDFFADLLETDAQRRVRTADIRLQVKYLRINRAPMENLLAEIDRRGLEELTGKECFAILDQVLEDTAFQPDSTEPVLEAFSVVSPVSLSDLTDAREVVEHISIPTPAPSPVAVVPERKSTPDSTPAPNATQDIPASKSSPTPKKQQSVQTSLYEELGADTRPTLADNFQRQKISKLREHLTINQKFMFTKMLFNGDFELFDQAIERLDRMDNLTQADRYLRDAYSEWDLESEEYLEFRQLIERRFLPA